LLEAPEAGINEEVTMKNLTLAAAVLVASLAGCTRAAGTGEPKGESFTLCDPARPEDMDCGFGQTLSRCEFVDEAKGRACEKGCMMQACESLRTCGSTSVSEACGASCADDHGGLYWQNLFASFDRCHADRYAQPPPGFSACVVNNVEALCAALVGTGWRDAHPTLRQQRP
jgi:hypothetical protein